MRGIVKVVEKATGFFNNLLEIKESASIFTNRLQFALITLHT